MSRCRMCDGNGWKSVDMLITYKDNSMIVKRAQRLTMPLEEVIEFRKKLGPGQEVVGAAIPCQCRQSAESAQ
jgi:hypothetical protein